MCWHLYLFSMLLIYRWLSVFRHSNKNFLPSFLHQTYLVSIQIINLFSSSAKTLLFSYIGMQSQEVTVRPKMRVILKADSQLIDEVIVVAYGTAKRSSFTGSVSTIKSEQLELRQVSNITNALSGAVAGVQVTNSREGGQPGSTAKIRVRGIGSMAAGNEPLYIVDGVPYDGDLSSINPVDIETTTVLKDAASNALYGSRGANGVVLITTKRGKIGEAVITVDAKWGTNKRSVPNYDVIKSPATYLEKAYEAMYNSQYYSNANKGNAANANAFANKYLPTNSSGGIGYQIYTIPSGESMIGMDGKLNPNATLGYSDGTYYYTPDNWYNELFDSGNLRQEYNMAVSGASEKLNYYMSAGYLDDTGLIAGSGFTRYSARVKADYQAKKYLKIGTNISYTNYDMQSPAEQNNDAGFSSANLFYITNNIAPIYPMYARKADGSILTDNRGYTVYDFGDRTTGGNFKRTFMSGSNPAAMVQLDKRQYIADVVSGRWYATIDIVDGLQFTYNIGVDLNHTNYKRLYNAYYGQYAQVGGIVYIGSNRIFSFNQQQLVTYKKIFRDVHLIDVLVGHETYKYKYQYLNGSKEKLFNPGIVEIDNAIKSPNISSFTNRYATEGYLARAQYEYDAKYILSASYRRDASSRFHKDNRWGDFGSVGAAWIASKESFLNSLKWIDLLKFKISYGIQGNDALQYADGRTKNFYPYQDQYTLSESNGDFATNMTYKGNKDITWETSHSFNAGVDFTLWKGYLSGSIEYFSRKTSDMLYYMPVSPSHGYAKKPKNIGSIVNSGVELDLNSAVVQTKDIKWNVYANATFIKNKIKKLAPELKGELIDGSRIYQEGKSMYQLYLRKYAGINDEGIALYYEEKKDADGKTTVTTTTNYNNGTQYASGDLLPDVYGGFGTTLNAYGFDFSLSFAYQLGGRVFDSAYQGMMHQGSASRAGQNWHTDILNAWAETNKNTHIPRLNSSDSYTNSNSDRFYISSNYLDLTNITLGYTLPKVWTTKLGISGVRIYGAADNVALFTKRKGLDPRQSYTSINATTYSPVRTISGGVKFTF